MKRSSDLIDYNEFILKENPFKNSAFETVYANYLLKRNSPDFYGSPCLPGCKTLIKDPSNFRKHIKRVHKMEFNSFTSSQLYVLISFRFYN